MLADSKTVDVVVKERGELDWRVVLEVLQGEWSLNRSVYLLEEKLNVYAGFILDGHMQSLYPASTPGETSIVVASVDPIPEQAIWLLEKVAKALEPYTVKITWTASGGLPPEGTPPPVGFVTS